MFHVTDLRRKAPVVKINSTNIIIPYYIYATCSTNDIDLALYLVCSAPYKTFTVLTVRAAKLEPRHFFVRSDAGAVEPEPPVLRGHRTGAVKM